MINITKLEYFVAVAENLNFSKAAKELMVAQTAVSYNIKELENELNVRLFIRTTRAVKLTPCGEIFYKGAKKIIAELNELKAEVQRSYNTLVLTIGFTETSLSSKFDEIIESFALKNPDIQLKLINSSTSFDLVNLLNSGSLDIACVYDFEQLPLEEKEQYCIAVCSDVVLLPPGHPLAEKATISSSDLYGETRLVLHPKPGNSAQRPFDALFRDTVVVQNLSSLEMMILARQGIAVLPGLNKGRFQRLVARDLINDLDPYKQTRLIFALNPENNNPAVDRLRTHLKEMV